MTPITEFRPGETYNGYIGGLYADKNPSHYWMAGIDKAEEIAKRLNIFLITIGGSQILLEYSALTRKILDISERKDMRFANAARASVYTENLDRRYWEYAKNEVRNFGGHPEDVAVIVLKIDSIIGEPDSRGIEHNKNKLIETIATIKVHFPKVGIIYLTGSDGAHWVKNDTKLKEPRAYNNSFACRETILYWINEYEFHKKLPFDVYVDWGFYCWSDGVTPRHHDNWIWTEQMTQDDGTNPSPLGRTVFAEFFSDSMKENAIAKVWMRNELAENIRLHLEQPPKQQHPLTPNETPKPGVIEGDLGDEQPEFKKTELKPDDFIKDPPEIEQAEENAMQKMQDLADKAAEEQEVIITEATPTTELLEKSEKNAAEIITENTATKEEIAKEESKPKKSAKKTKASKKTKKRGTGKSKSVSGTGNTGDAGAEKA